MKKNIKTVVKYIITPLIALSLFFGTAFAAVSYDPDTDYMKLMIQAAIKGDQDALDKAVACRNAKIEGEGLSYDPVSAKELIKTFESRVGFSLSTDYMTIMKNAALSGDYTAGREAAQKRNIKISYLDMSYAKWGFDDFVLLCKVIQNEAGSDWLPMDWKMAVGEVLLNRVASSKFPNTLYDCVYQPKQYANKGAYNGMVLRNGNVAAAVNLLNGKRYFYDPNVLFQAKGIQGPVAKAFYDPYLGTEYFCYG